MQIRLRNALSCMVNGSMRSYAGGSVIELPASEAQHLLNTGRAEAVEPEAPAATAAAPTAKPKPKRGA